MRKYALLFAAMTLAMVHVAHGQGVDFSETGFGSAKIMGPRKPTVELAIGYSSDDVNFDIASDPTGELTPNVLSELNWYDMGVTSLRGDLQWPIGKGLRVRGMFEYGIILDGEALDTDYLGDNRTDVWFKSTASVSGNTRYQAELEFGWEFRFAFAVKGWRIGESDRRRAIVSEVSLTPSIGYQIAGHEINFEDGVEVVPPSGPFGGLDSYYEPEWQGPTSALDLRMRVGKRWMLSTRYTYSDWLDFTADGTWNLRDDWQQNPSFTQTADGSGESVRVRLEYLIGRRKEKSVYLSYIDTDYSTDAGRDTTYFADGGSIVTRLNEATWSSQGFELGFRMRF
jgi:hypothetical protein